MKLVRHLAAVLALAAVVALTGIAWNHFAPASLPGEGQAGGTQFIAVPGKDIILPPGAKLPPPGVRPPPGARLNTPIGGGSIPVDIGDLLKPVNLVVFRNTAILEAEIAAGVVILSIAARKYRRARRRRALTRPPERADGTIGPLQRPR
jgi:hypothetical protein